MTAPSGPHHDVDHDWIVCWQCEGAGRVPDCFEDCCSGMDCDPDDPDLCCNPKRCDVCNGKRGWAAT